MAATLTCSAGTACGALKRLVRRPLRRNLPLAELGGGGMMGLAFAQAIFKQPISVADLGRAVRETARTNGAAVASDPAEPAVAKRMLEETAGALMGSSISRAMRNHGVRSVSCCARRQSSRIGADGRRFQHADGAVDLRASHYRKFMVGSLKKQGTDYSGALRAPIRYGAEGWPPEMVRPIARAQSRRVHYVAKLRLSSTTPVDLKRCRSQLHVAGICDDVPAPGHARIMPYARRIATLLVAEKLAHPAGRTRRRARNGTSDQHLCGGLLPQSFR